SGRDTLRRRTEAGRVGTRFSSERLAYVEEEIEMLQHLGRGHSRGSRRRRRRRIRDGESRRIEVVSQIEAHRSDGRFIPNANADSHRHIVKIAGRGLGIETSVTILLHEPGEVVHHIGWRGKDVAYVVKEHKAQVIADVR